MPSNCTPDTATPFATLAWPLAVGVGEGILTQIATLIDNLDSTIDTSTSLLSCTAHETCLATYADTLFCYDALLGAFHDRRGTVGNAVSGEYVLEDGTKGNLYMMNV